MRKIQIVVRVDESEKEKLERRAEKLGVKLSTYLRLAALNFRV